MKRDILVRLITGLAGISIVIPALIYSPYGLWVLGTVVSLIALWEYYTGMGLKSNRYLIPSLGMAGLFWALIILKDFVELPENIPFFIAVLSLPLAQLLALFDPKLEKPIEHVATIMLGYIYVVLPFYLFYSLGTDLQPTGYTPYLPLGILILTWTLDVAAYFFGRFIGGKLLFPRITPKKTWAGAIGGALSCIGMAGLLHYFFPEDLFNWWIMAGIIAVMSQFGDLVESMFKRSVRLKDSGNVLPGHGGMLDRFDGMLMSIPFLYLYFLMG